MFRMKVFLFLLIVDHTLNTLVFGKPTDPPDHTNFLDDKRADVGQFNNQNVKVIL